MDEQRAISFAIRAPLARPDLPGLCARVCRLFAQGYGPVAHCDVAMLEADAVTVDALARLQLAAHRYGCQIRLRGASRELLELLVFAGLEDVLPG